MLEGGLGTKGIIMEHPLQSLDTELATIYSPLVNRALKYSYIIYMQANKYTGNGKSHR